MFVCRSQAIHSCEHPQEGGFLHAWLVLLPSQRQPRSVFGGVLHRCEITRIRFYGWEFSILMQKSIFRSEVIWEADVQSRENTVSQTGSLFQGYSWFYSLLGYHPNNKELLNWKNKNFQNWHQKRIYRALSLTYNLSINRRYKTGFTIQQFLISKNLNTHVW